MSENNPWLLAQASFKYFVVKFLGYRWPIHYQEWADILEDNNRILYQAPRGHGKSVFFSLAYPLWRVIRGKTEVLLVSYSEDQVRRLIREIRICVETNPFLMPLRPSTAEIWGTDQLSFSNGSFISGLGFGTSSRGRHPDVIVVDDPLKDLGGMTDEDQERAYFGVITGMAMEKTKLMTVGTPVNFGDLLEKLEKNEAYAQWKKPAVDKHGNALFPELKSKEFLEKTKKEMGSINFAREYMLQRIDPATQPFKRQYEMLYTELPGRFTQKVTICDPAYSENQGDYSAIVTVGFTGGNHAYVLEAKAIRREDPGAVVNELVRTIRAHEPQVVGIEKRKGDAIQYTFQEWRTRLNLWDFKYVELQTHGISKDKRINAVGGLVSRWEGRNIHIHAQMQLLRAQLYAYRFDDKSSEHDDLVDALAYCFHPDIIKPNSGAASIPRDVYEASIEGKPRYQLGQDTTWAPKEQIGGWNSGNVSYGKAWASMLDKRNHEVVQ